MKKRPGKSQKNYENVEPSTRPDFTYRASLGEIKPSLPEPYKIRHKKPYFFINQFGAEFRGYSIRGLTAIINIGHEYVYDSIATFIMEQRGRHKKNERINSKKHRIFSAER